MGGKVDDKRLLPRKKTKTRKLPEGDIDLQQHDGEHSHEDSKHADDDLADPHDGVACSPGDQTNQPLLACAQFPLSEPSQTTSICTCHATQTMQLKDCFQGSLGVFGYPYESL